jgi:hypothetical protein
LCSQKVFFEYLKVMLNNSNLSKNNINSYLKSISFLNSELQTISRNNPHSTDEYHINLDLKSNLKNAMSIENKQISKFANQKNQLDKSNLYFSLASFNLYSSIYNNLYSRNDFTSKELYYCTKFDTQSNAINLIVNSLKESSETLYLDGYILNLKNFALADLFNFYIELRDARGIVFASKLFKNIDIAGNLGVYSAKKVYLPFLSKEYELFNTDLRTVTWYYTYDFV